MTFRISEAAFSATITVGICVLALGTRGMIEASATKSPSTPLTLVLEFDDLTKRACSNGMCH